MSYTVECPVNKFRGSVTLPEHLTMPQVLLWEDAAIEGKHKRAEFIGKIAKAKEEALAQGKTEEEASEQLDTTSMGITDAQLEQLYLKAICAIVEKWDIKGFPDKVTPDNFPASPRAEASLFVAWVIGEVAKLYTGEITVPNV